jgi:hypothetical protein
MVLSLSASTVKHYFQYRCERQLRYRMMSRASVESAFGALSPDEPDAWRAAGNQYESRLIDNLSDAHTVLRPPEDGKLSAVETLAFLRIGGPQRFIAQARLEVTSERLDARLELGGALRDAVELSPGYPDLIEVVTDKGVPPSLRIIDIKATTRATLFHRVQVAYYALLLQSVLAQHGIPLPLLPDGEIWHVDPGGAASYRRSPFRLAGYMAQVAEFLGRVVPRVARAAVTGGRDETRFNVYFKCEQCEFLAHCRQAVDPAQGSASLDLSAVPGMTQETKYLLRNAMSLFTVRDLAASPIEFDRGPGGDAVSADVDLRSDPRANWLLRTRGDVLVRRARAIAEGTVSLLPDRYTHRMPGGYDVGIFLVVDHDPVEGRLATLGYLRRWIGRPDAYVTAAVQGFGPAAERDAIAAVLGAVVRTLDEVDGLNAGGAAALRAHIFIYEPTEARDLSAALGRHLADEAVRGGLIQMLRMFPPEGLIPEPEYRGVSHLPATALRDIVEDLFALPCVVSYDLRSVSAALRGATPPIEVSYEPPARFVRPFSSRLNIDVCRSLKTGDVPPSEVEADLVARLCAMASIAAWLVAQSSAADRGFLRLPKVPFRWQSSFNPLGPSDLDVLRAHELLLARGEELTTLVSLAAPWQARRDRQRCFARLRLLDARPYLNRIQMRFAVPVESRRAELEVDARGLILTDDHPDLRLDPAMWARYAAHLSAITRSGDQVVLTVETSSVHWERLQRKTPDDGWFIDQVNVDLNFPRMDSFLRYLAASEQIP